MVAITTFTATLAFAASVLALPNPYPSPLTPDPSGDKNIGNGNGQQFITGACLSDADCASTCCAVLGSGGICSGTAVSTAQGKQGCGFNGAGGAAAAAAAPASTPAAAVGTDAGAGTASAAPAAGTAAASASTGSTLTPDPSGAKNVGNGQGQQFITGACLADADCASGCCAVLGSGGICSGTAVSFAQGKQGCGFTGAGAAAAAAGTNAASSATTSSSAAAGSGTSSGAKAVVTSPIVTSAAGSQNVGKGNGQQFITGQCLSDADCASACCATKGSAGVCSAVAVANDQGKTGCGFQGVAA